ncbi:MAG: PAS domain-containing sensor histidine kinase [bacterium]|nr:PAS domain-containing sensor histidine kinase [bacterium]MCP5070520.1 PAS domain-containing sensor histidine kinase [bacterium]
MSAAVAEQSGIEVDTTLPLIQGLTQLHDWVALMDAQGQILWLSDALASTCGGGRSFKGQHWLDSIVHAEDRSRLEATLLSEDRVSGEPVLLTSDHDEPCYATVSAARVTPGCGALVAIFRHQEERSAEMSSTLRYLAAVLDSSPDGVVVIDRSRFITYANPAMLELSGWSHKELVDRPLAAFLQSQDDLESIAQALSNQTALRGIELAVRRHDDSPIDVSVSVSRLALRDGTQVGAVAYVQDITGRRQYERDLSQKNEELEHYVHAVSHDLRSPLVSILGFSRLLREDFAPALGKKGQHFLQRIEEAGRTMESLIQELLEFSRIGVSDAPCELVNPREVLLQLQAELKPRLDEEHVLLELPADPPMLLLERTRLYQLFSNLIGNALRHMGPGPELRIEVAIEKLENATRISVSDNGVGIEAAEHERIFEIFQSGIGNGSTGGTGMGLAIVKKITDSRGGRIWVESQPGHGATFHVELPCA